MKRLLWTRALRALFGAKTQPVTNKKRGPALEHLETRLAPATYIWTGGAGGDNRWSRGGNWAGGVAPTGSVNTLDDLVFPNGPTVKTSNNDIPVVAGVAATFNSITVSGSNYVFNGNRITLGDPSVSSGFVIVNSGATGARMNFNVGLAGAAGNRQFFTVNFGADLTIAGRLSGDTGVELTKSGVGTLVLTADNSAFTGPITVDTNGGILRITNALALGDTATGTTVATNAQLQLQNITGVVNEPLIINGPGTANNGVLLNVAGDNVIAANVEMDSDSFIGATAGSLNLTGVLSDLGAGHSLTKVGPGQLILSNANTYRGLTTINNGLLTIRNALALGEGGLPENGTIVNTSPTGTGTLQLEATTGTGFVVVNELLTLNGAGVGDIGALHNLLGDNGWANTVTNGSPGPGFADVSIGAAATASGAMTNLTISGVVQTPNGDNNLTKVGLGRVIFSNANTYAGFTTVAAGALNIRDSRGLGSTVKGTTVRIGAALELEIDSGSDPFGRDLGDDSVTADPLRLKVSEPLEINGRGITNTGALRSISGINEYAANILLGSLSTAAAIGVDPDPSPEADGTYFTDDYSLTVTGVIQGPALPLTYGTSLYKALTGHLILPFANTYTGLTFIDQGWVTIQNPTSLGARIPGLGDTVQPGTTVANGAALHLRPFVVGTNMTVAENLTLRGLGIEHPFALIGEKGSLMNLSGNNVSTGEIALGGNVGIGVEEVIPGVFSELTTKGTITDFDPVLNFEFTASGGTPEERFPIDTGATSGRVEIDYEMYSVPDRLSVYYDGVRIFDTGFVSGGATVVIPYGPGSSTLIEVIMNEGGGNSGTVWDLTRVQVFPDVAPNFDLFKLGSRRLQIQGDGTYRGTVDIKEGVLRVQHDTALGTSAGGTIIREGTALELAPGIPETNGGVVAGVQTWGEALTVYGTGNSLFNLHPVTVLSDDHMWRGPVHLANDVTVDVRTNSRFTIAGTIDDALNPDAAGSDLVKVGAGEMGLAGANVYKGATLVNEGILTVQNGQALGTTAAGTVVANGATIQLEGNIAVAGESLTLQGIGVVTPPSTSLNRWFNAGPAPIANGENPGNTANAGRVTGVAVDPTDPDVIYVATAGGGAWKTKDGGEHWLPMFDARGQALLFGGAIAVSTFDPRVIYFGTGEANNSADSYAGSGIYKSSDSGKTWALVTNPDASNPHSRKSVTKIVIDPQNPNIFYAATSDRNVGATPGNAGVWRYDGIRWRNLTNVVSAARLAAVPPITVPGPDDDFRISFTDTGATWSDIALVGTTLFAALGTADGSTTNAVYRCPLPSSSNPVWYIADGATDSQADGFPVRAGTGTIRVGGSGATIYATVSSTTGALIDIQKSEDGGVTWDAIGAAPPTDYLGGQGNYDHALFVVDANTFYIAGRDKIYLSTDGGGDAANWFDLTVGPDGFGPRVEFFGLAVAGDGQLIVGSGGGVWRAADPTDMSDPLAWVNANGDLAITQANGVAANPNDLTQGFIGAQDVGTSKFTNSPAWTLVDGGDGGEVRYDPKNPSTVYHIQNTSLRKSVDGGTNWTTILGVANVRTQFVVDTVNTSRLVVGGGSLRESVDGGANWITLPLPTTPAVVPTVIATATYQGRFTADPAFPFVVDRQADTYDPDTIYISDGTRIRVTKDHALSWANRNASFGNIVNLVVDPRNRDVVFAVSNTLGADKVWKSSDAGRTWDALSLGLPDVQAWKLVLDPRNGTLYLGMDSGVYRLDQGAGTWSKFGIGIGNVQVKALDLNPATNVLTAGTYGRSMQQFFLSDVQPNAGVLRAVAGSSVWTGPVFLAGPTTISAGGTQGIGTGQLTAQLNIVGVISDLTPGANYKLDKIGDGDVILGGSNTYGGVTEIKEGVLVVTNAMALGSPLAPTLVNVGTALELQSNLDAEPLFLSGDGIEFNDHFTGALRNVSNFNTYTGVATLRTSVTIGVDTGSQLTMTNTITDGAGSFTLTKELTGRLVLSGANDYDGTTFVFQGALAAANNLALGSPNTTQVLDGAQLQLQGNITVTGETAELSGTGIFGTGAMLNVSGDNTWRGPVSLATLPGFSPPTVPPAKVSFGANVNTTMTIDGVVSEVGGIFGVDKVGTGRVTLQQANTYRGATVVFAGALRIENGQALGAFGTPLNGTTVRNGAALELNGGITTTAELLTISGAGQGNAGALRNISGTNTYTGPVTLQGSASIGADAGSTMVVSGDVRDPGAFPSTAGTLTKVGVGTVVFPNAKTYRGQTVVAAGVLNIRDANALGDPVNGAGTTVQSGATLQLQGGITVTGESLTINGTGVNNAGALENLSGNNTWGRTLTLGSNSSIGVTADSLNVNAAIVGGAFGVTKVGPGTLEYSGTAANTYTGLTQVNEGTLVLNKSGVTAVAGNLTVGDGVTGDATVRLTQSEQVVNTSVVLVQGDGLLDLNNQNETVGPLTMVDGQARTGSGQLTVTSLDMTGATVTLDMAASRLNVIGNVTATSSATNRARITGLGQVPITGTKTFTVADGPQVTDLIVEAILSGTGGLVKNGAGRLELDAANTYTGVTQVNAGDVQVDGTITSDVQLLNVAATLSGVGTVGTISGAGAAVGTVAPGDNDEPVTTGILRSKGVTWGPETTFSIQLNGTAAGTQHDKLIVDGNVQLGGATLLGFTGPAVIEGDSFIVIQTLNGGIVSGQFAAGDRVFIGGKKFLIDYSNPTQVVLNRVKADVAVDLTASTNPTVFGQPVTFTVQVTPEPGAGALVPGDTVTFILDGGVRQTLTLDGNGRATWDPQTFTGQSLSVGTHTIDVLFNGDEDFLPNNDSLQQTVNRASTVINMSTNPTAPVFGEAVTVFAAVRPVAPGAGIPTGSVIFTVDGVTQVASTPLNSAGVASIVLTGLSPTVHRVSVTYAGDTSFTPSATLNDFTFVVSPAPSFVNVTANPITSQLGQSVTFTATVTANPPGAGTATGTVRFYDGAAIPANLLATRNLDGNGQATFTTSTLIVGAHTITVAYSGSVNIAPGTGTLGFTVNPAATSTQVNTASSVNPSVFGQAVVFTATVATVSPGVGTPQGTVTFVIGGVASAPVQLNPAGVATLTRNDLPVGVSNVVANYNGSVNFAASSGSMDQTVNRAGTTVVVGSSRNPSAQGQGVVFTATVNPVAPGAGVPTDGTVTFVIDGVSQAPVLVSGTGQATITRTNLSIGSHTIFARYNGSTNYANSANSPALTQRVVEFSSTTTVTKSVTSSVYGQNVTYTARAVGSGNVVPTGTVTFIIDGVPLNAKPLDASGRAAITINWPGVGQHTIVARYNGSSRFASSTGSVGHTVNKANSRPLLASSRNPGAVGQPVTFTATLGAVAPGAGTPNSGTVTWFVDGQQRAVTNVSTAGRASLTVDDLTLGNHTVQAVYDGNGNFNGSTSAVFQQIMQDPPEATQLTVAVTPTGSIAVGSLFTVRVFARDNDGNLSTTYNGPVTLSLVRGPTGGVLSGTKSRTFANGQAAFGGLSVNRSGRYRIRVTSGTLVTEFEIVTNGRQT